MKTSIDVTTIYKRDAILCIIIALIWDQTDDKRQKQEGRRKYSGHLGGLFPFHSIHWAPTTVLWHTILHILTLYHISDAILVFSVLYSQIKDSCLPDYVLVGVRFRLKKQKDRKIGSQKTRNTMEKWEERDERNWDCWVTGSTRELGL